MGFIHLTRAQALPGNGSHEISDSLPGTARPVGRPDALSQHDPVQPRRGGAVGGRVLGLFEGASLGQANGGSG